jgi:hypothetical protein
MDATIHQPHPLKLQLIEVSKQDFAVISELAGVYYDDCIYQLLLAQLRQNNMSSIWRIKSQI